MNFPPTESAGPRDKWLSDGEAKLYAQSLAVGPDGEPISPTEQAALPTIAKEMTAVEAAKLLNEGEALDPRLDGDREVWVVSVHGYVPRDSMPQGSELPPLHHGYTVVLDAATGFNFFSAYGLEAFS